VRPRWHRHRWHAVAVEHLGPAAGQDPPHGWSVIKRVCSGGRCAGLAASVLPGWWTLAEARAVPPWTAAAPGPGALAGGVGAVARQRAAIAGHDWAGPGFTRDGCETRHA
jgi:hypothetical protein